ncbi:LysR family transcriptional regulator [Streptosporangiaceae bacterium NEAU-GS5]|nr:LysR family transcriptional regulator [Streptosporangiaceae bacterium NEAU-GS5]
MDPHLLRAFVTVSRLGSFSAAAGELGYTQSAVSQQIAALEADLGTRLLGRRPVAPTAAGRRLLEHAGPLLLRLAAARADVARAAAAPVRPLRIAATPLALPAALQAPPPARLPAAAPRVLPPGARVSTAALEQVIERVATGEADLGLVDGVAAPSDPLALPQAGPLTAVRVGEEPLVVALPAGHPLAGRAGLDLADLADARWLDAPQISALPRLRLAARMDGLRPGARYDGHDVRTLLALAAAGHGLVLLPRSAAGDGPVVALARPRLVHRVEVVHGALPPGPAAALVTSLSV